MIQNSHFATPSGVTSRVDHPTAPLSVTVWLYWVVTAEQREAATSNAIQTIGQKWIVCGAPYVDTSKTAIYVFFSHKSKYWWGHLVAVFVPPRIPLCHQKHQAALTFNTALNEVLAQFKWLPRLYWNSCNQLWNKNCAWREKVDRILINYLLTQSLTIKSGIFEQLSSPSLCS